MKKIFITLAMLFTIQLTWASPTEALKYLPVQDKGRIKPFDSYARETLQVVYGKQKYMGKAATDVVFTWYLIPDHWQKEPIIQVSHAGLRESLNLDSKKTMYSASELILNDRMRLFFQELASKRTAGEKLSGYYQAVQRLENQMSAMQAIRMGYGLPFFPQTKAQGRWRSIAEIEKGTENEKRFFNITEAYVKSVSDLMVKEKPKGDGTAVTKAVNDFIDWQKKTVREDYFNKTRLDIEVAYNNLQPFTWSWVLYLLGAILLSLKFLFKKKWLYMFGVTSLLIGFVLHTYGFGLRIYLAGRPPVSNMYETLLWVPWGALFFAFVLEKIKKTRLALIVSAVAAALCMIITSFAPNVFDPSLQPLEPVLRSSFWLTTHVLIITISYGAFFIAWGIANVMLVVYCRGEQKYKDFLKESAQSIYRCIQIGVVLLAAGIILGGVWADYSWGRFWGWDPKETWAFIALMGYLAMLHGRLAGWFKEFSMAVGSIVSFVLVVMAWYGVNYVLGAGLHSYGFGVGGVEYVAFVVFIQLVFVALAAVMRHSALKK